MWSKRNSFEAALKQHSAASVWSSSCWSHAGFFRPLVLTIIYRFRQETYFKHNYTTQLFRCDNHTLTESVLLCNLFFNSVGTNVFSLPRREFSVSLLQLTSRISPLPAPILLSAVTWCPYLWPTITCHLKISRRHMSSGSVRRIGSLFLTAWLRLVSAQLRLLGVGGDFYGHLGASRVGLPSCSEILPRVSWWECESSIHMIC